VLKKFRTPQVDASDPSSQRGRIQHDEARRGDGRKRQGRMEERRGNEGISEGRYGRGNWRGKEKNISSS